MRRTPYTRFNGDDLILRDYLAADRTVLANERTFLAFIRTALTLLVGGITFVRFFNHTLVEIIGWAFIPLALVVMGLGVRKYIQMRRILARLEAEAEAEKGLSGSIHDS
jgi:putative membrane protein